MSQSDATWIDLGGRLRDVVLQEHLRAYMALQHLPHPEVQSPQLIAFLGDTEKRKLTNSIFSIQSSAHEKILLRSIPGSSGANPLLFADCELHNNRTVTDCESGTIERHSLSWHRNAPRSLDLRSVASLVYTQLLLPFSTVFCIFARDFEGTEEIAVILSTWLKPLRNRPSGQPPTTFTRILIMVEREDQAGFDEKLATTEFVIQFRRVIQNENGLFGQLKQDLTNAEFENLLKDRFFEVRILPLPSSAQGQVKTQTTMLRNRILQESQDIHNLRKAAKIAFSARHFIGFFSLACRHFAKDIVSPFSFIKASRNPNSIPADFGSKIYEFIQIVPSENKDMIVPVIASALRLDNFPPGAHGEYQK